MAAVTEVPKGKVFVGVLLHLRVKMYVRKETEIVIVGYGINTTSSILQNVYSCRCILIINPIYIPRDLIFFPYWLLVLLGLGCLVLAALLIYPQ